MRKKCTSSELKQGLRFLALWLSLILRIPLQLVVAVLALFLLTTPLALFAFFTTITHKNFHYLRDRNRSHFVVIHMRNGEVQQLIRKAELHTRSSSEQLN